MTKVDVEANGAQADAAAAEELKRKRREAIAAAKKENARKAGVELSGAASSGGEEAPKRRKSSGKKKKRKSSKNGSNRRRSLERSDSLESIKSSFTLEPIEEAENESLNASSHHSNNTPKHQGRNESKDLTIKQGDIEMGLDPTDGSSESSKSVESSPANAKEENQNSNKFDGKDKKKFYSDWSKRRWMLVIGCLVGVVMIAIIGAASGALKVSLSASKGSEETPETQEQSNNGHSSSSNQGNSLPLEGYNIPELDQDGMMKSIYLNAWDWDYKGYGATRWLPDLDFLDGYEGTTFTDCTKRTKQVAATNDPELYCTERWFGDGVGRYQINVPEEEADYQVVLHFAETFHDEPGQRLFDVYIEEELVRGGFDIFKAAGAKDTAVVLMHTAAVWDGSLTIELFPLPGKDNPKINAIEVHNLHKARSPDDYELVAADSTIEKKPSTPSNREQPPVVVEQPPQEQQTSPEDTNEQPQDTPKPPQNNNKPKEDSNKPPQDNSEPPQDTEDAPRVFSLPIRINAGGVRFTDNDGNQWENENGRFKQENLIGDARSHAQCPQGNEEVADPIDLLYCSERWFSGGEGGYELPLEEGVSQVRVIFHFAEFFHENIGDRVMNLIIENKTVRADYDILGATGGRRSVPTKLARTIDVTDGILNIKLEPVVGKPKISAIEVLPVV